MFKPSIPLNLQTVEAGRPRKVARASIFGPTAQVVPRAACSFERVWMPRTDKKGIEAVRLRVARDGKEAGTTGTFVERRSASGPGFLNVWTWDTRFVRDDTASARGIYVPETFARVQGSDGTRLAECLTGFEGQIWDGGQLAASRWWRARPSMRDWREFVSGSEVTNAGATGDTDRAEQPPEPEIPAWRDDLSLSDIGPSVLKGLMSPARAALAAGVILAIPLGYVSGSAIKLMGYNTSTAHKLAKLEEDVGDVIDARRVASDNKLQIERFRRIGDPFKLIDVLIELRAAVGPDSVTLRYLAFDTENIEVKMSMANNPPLADLVSHLESGDVWRNVSATTEAGNIIVLRGELGEADGAS